MLPKNDTVVPAWAGHREQVIQRLLPTFAALTLIPMLAALIAFWPIPYLGIAIDAPSGTILGVDPGSAAARADILPGDRVVAIYDYAWQDADRQLVLFPLAWQTVSAIPLQIERHGVVTPLMLAVDPPDTAYQLEKVAAFGLGLICWLVGYLIGVVRRHDPTGTTMVAWFWMGLGALVGCYTFALYSSYPLSLVLRWLLLSVIAPISVSMHVWFPVRSVAPATARRARRWLIGSLLAVQVVFVSGIIVFQPSVRMLIDRLSLLTPIGLTAAFLASGIILWRSYARMTVAHGRRQIRLLGSACLVIACSWLGLRTIPLLLDIPPVLPEYVIDLISGLLPLAYLASSVTRDLYRLDRLMLRVALHTLTTLILIGLLLLATHVIRLRPPVQAA